MFPHQEMIEEARADSKGRRDDDADKGGDRKTAGDGEEL
jgi:hypothetical protein